MEDSSAMGMRRSTEKPPHSRRRRAPPPPAPAPPPPSAWPAFPQEIKGLGQGRQSPVSSSPKNAESLLARSPNVLGSLSGSGVGGSGSGRRDSSTARVSGGKSPGIVRNKASCCDSCRPSHQAVNHPKGSGTRIEYDDVFGGPPKYLTSVSTSSVERKSSLPDYDDIFQSSIRRSFSGVQSAKVGGGGGGGGYTKTRACSELPVFDPPEYQAEVLKASPRGSQRSPEASGEIAYDDVFGGPLTGQRSKLLKDLLRCSGFVKPGATSTRGVARASPPSDSSPVSSLHSICRETQGNPIYDVYGDVKHFNSPHMEAADKSPQAPSYGELEGNRKPAVTSVSASSSPFTEQFDDSTVYSYSTRASVNANHERDKIHRTVAQPVRSVSKTGLDVASSSTSESSCSESEYVNRPSSLKPKGRKYRGGKGRRTSKARASDAQRPSNGKRFVEDKVVDERSSTERSFGMGQEFLSGQADESLVNSADEWKMMNQAKQVSFITVSKVQLKTEPTSLPPVRPAPSKTVDILSEKEMSELLETEAFMEYSIKDLDGLVAEEYLVSHESVSESSPSTSISNSINTSVSGRTYEDEDSDHCYAKDTVSPVSPEGAEAPAPNFDKVENLKNGLKEAISSSTEEQPSKEGLTSSSNEFSCGTGSGDLSSLCEFEEKAGEMPELRRSRWERHQREVERVAKALAEKNSRDLEAERAEAEKQRVSELLEDVIKRWAAGKQGNLRALLSTLQYILWPECGWQAVSLIDIIEPAAVRKAYRKATLFVHPDKLQQKNASAEHRFIAEKVFNLLQEAWTSFNYEQMF